MAFELVINLKLNDKLNPMPINNALGPADRSNHNNLTNNKVAATNLLLASNERHDLTPISWKSPISNWISLQDAEHRAQMRESSIKNPQNVY